MRNLIRVEELGLVLLAAFLFSQLNYAWWLFAVLLLAPDLSMAGYLGGPQLGSISYNLFHHKGVAVLVYIAGVILLSPPVQFAGLILLAHSSLDRVFGYGLKYPDSFRNTHLGAIGPEPTPPYPEA